MNPYRESEPQPEPAEHRWALLDVWHRDVLGWVRLRLCRDCGLGRAEFRSDPLDMWKLLAIESPLIADRPSVVAAVERARARREARFAAWRERQRGSK